MPPPIDTTHPEYLRLHANLVEVRIAVAPYVAQFIQMTPENKRAWLRADPFMRDVARIAVDLHRIVDQIKDDVR